MQSVHILTFVGLSYLVEPEISLTRQILYLVIVLVLPRPGYCNQVGVRVYTTYAIYMYGPCIVDMDRGLCMHMYDEKEGSVQLILH